MELLPSGKRIFDGRVDIRYSGHGAYRTEYHIVWIPKYRRRILNPKIKGMTASRLRKKFSWLGKVYWRENVVWSSGYFVTTIGIDEDKILKYIAWQQTQDLGQAKLEF
jgi:putative transposase